MYKKILPLGALVAIAAALVIIFVKPNDNTASNDQATTGNVTEGSDSENTPANLAQGTKFYSSDKLGVKFRYKSMSDLHEVVVEEKDSKIYLHLEKEALDMAKTIEVFDKDPNKTLKQAIEERFLKNYSRANCYVEDSSTIPELKRPDGYEVANISYPAPTDPNDPFWENRDKCDPVYSKTNDVRYFLYNPSVPNKYVFLILGQDSIASDGTPPTPDGGKDWSASIEIY
jgi:hypothetical protein